MNVRPRVPAGVRGEPRVLRGARGGLGSPFVSGGRHRAGSIAILVIAAGAAPGCAEVPVLRGRIQGLAGVVAQASRNGAQRCAPRELAMAEAQLRFATTDLDQGETSKAEAHLAMAEPNAKAAMSLSPPDKCVVESGVRAKPGDRDGDGLPDRDDKCPDEPETYNTFQDEDGCPDDPDTDGDHVADSVDHCVLEPEDVDGYLDDDGCPDLDNDADGIPDTADKCPKEAEDLDGWEDDDGCPDPDNDKDMVLDVDDFCPNVPGPPAGDRPGCPKKDVPVIVTATEIRITQQIQFEFNKAVIKKQSWPILDAVRDVLRAFPKINIEVQGHTDNVGNAGYNMKLSQSRADAVSKYLTDHGIEPSRLAAKGYGPTQPIVPNNTEPNRALNRRVQFIRTEKGTPNAP